VYELQLTYFHKHLKTLLVNNGTDFTTALYCHCLGSRDVIGHVTILQLQYMVSYRWSIVTKVGFADVKSSCHTNISKTIHNISTSKLNITTAKCR